MRQIRQHVIKVQRQLTATTFAKGDIQPEVTYTPYQRLTQVPVTIQEERLPSNSGQVFPQCMNAIRSPNRPKINKRVQVTLRTRTTVKRTRMFFSPIKIPGTPPEQTGEAEGTDSELEDINLFLMKSINDYVSNDLKRKHNSQTNKRKIMLYLLSNQYKEKSSLRLPINKAYRRTHRNTHK